MRTTISPEYQVEIRRTLREPLHPKPGEKVEFLKHRNRIGMVPVGDIKKMRGLLKGLTQLSWETGAGAEVKLSLYIKERRCT